MKIKKETIYKNLYISSDFEATTGKQMQYFLFCGDRNWDYFYDKRVEDKKYFDQVNNVKIIEFFTQDDLSKYLKTLPKIKLLDFSCEKDFYVVLESIN